MTGVLDGLRVLDFGPYIAGPFCAALLGDLGADVIRIEKVDGSEDRFIAPRAEADAGAMFLQVNRNKRGLTCNPLKPEGRELVRRLVATADVVVANLPDPALEAMGLDYASLTAIRPDIVLATVNAFGSGGSWSDRLGFDGVGQVMSGAAYLSGPPETPSKSWALWVDFTTASLAASATLAALLHRERTGEGQHVDGALLESALTVMNNAVVEQAITAPNRVASDNRGQTVGPADIFPTTDGWIIVQVIGQTLFRRWLALIDEPAWAEDERFVDDWARGEHRNLLAARAAAWCADLSTTDALDRLDAAGIPSRCSTIPTSPPWASSSRPSTPVSRCRNRSPGHPSPCPPRLRGSATAPPCSASTPPTSSPTSATTPPTSSGCRQPAWCEPSIALGRDH